MTKLITLKREIISNRAVLGRLYIDDKEICKTLENPYLNNLPHVSCIPEGTYKVEAFSGRRFKNVWQIMDVPNRSYILIHKGNREKNTHGCILVGQAYGFLDQQLAVLNSAKSLQILQNILSNKFILIIYRMC